MLEKEIRKHKLIKAHRTMVKSGQYVAAKYLLKLLLTGSVHLGLDDDSWIVEKTCEDIGCPLFYTRRGYSAIAHI